MKFKDFFHICTTIDPGKAVIAIEAETMKPLEMDWVNGLITVAGHDFYVMEVRQAMGHGGLWSLVSLRLVQPFRGEDFIPMMEACPKAREVEKCRGFENELPPFEGEDLPWLPPAPLLIKLPNAAPGPAMVTLKCPYCFAQVVVEKVRLDWTPVDLSCGCKVSAGRLRKAAGL